MSSSKDPWDCRCHQETRALILKHLLWAKSENVTASQRGGNGKERGLKPLHARHGGLFRCQEVRLMVMGQMREECWGSPHYHLPHPLSAWGISAAAKTCPTAPLQPHPKTSQQTRSKEASLQWAHASVRTCSGPIYFSGAFVFDKHAPSGLQQSYNCFFMMAK